jgi:hypothetical protein
MVGSNLVAFTVATLTLACVAISPAEAGQISRNSATIDQQGRGNAAGVYQGGQGNAASLNQIGRNNTGVIDQPGNNNTGCLVQAGRNLDGALVQSGDSGSLGVVQTNRAVRQFNPDRCFHRNESRGYLLRDAIRGSYRD